MDHTPRDRRPATSAGIHSTLQQPALDFDRLFDSADTIYVVGTEDGFGKHFGSIFQALFWPAFMVYEAFSALGG